MSLDSLGMQTSFSTDIHIFLIFTSADESRCSGFLAFVELASELGQKEHVHGSMNDKQCKWLLIIILVGALIRKGRGDRAIGMSSDHKTNLFISRAYIGTPAKLFYVFIGITQVA
jgi:hypothetical protein